MKNLTNILNELSLVFSYSSSDSFSYKKCVKSENRKNIKLLKLKKTKQFFCQEQTTSITFFTTIKVFFYKR